MTLWGNKQQRRIDMEPMNHKEYRILIVEDDEEIRDGIEIFL